MSWPAVRTKAIRMKSLAAIAAAAFLLAGCDAGSTSQASTSTAGFATVNNVPPRPAPLEQPAMLHDEAPPPKPKVMAWETPKPVISNPEDERFRASLPFSPAIAMDPVDGSKISMRATTLFVEYKGRFYYFSNETNKKLFEGNPESALKGGFMKL